MTVTEQERKKKKNEACVGIGEGIKMPHQPSQVYKRLSSVRKVGNEVLHHEK